VSDRLVLDDVEVDGRAGRAVVVEGGRIRDVGPAGSRPPTALPEGGAPPAAASTTVVAGRGAALLPGLHDHHVHLFAFATTEGSVWCGAPDVDSAGALARRLREAAATGPFVDPGGWIRAVGWDETVAGWPSGADLDAAVPDRPVRLKHRGGDLWVLNGPALQLAGLDRTAPPSGSAEPWPPGVELGPDDRPTGRIWGLDGWLRQRIGGVAPSLAGVSAALAASGVTGVTDAGAHNGAAELAALAGARRSGELSQGLAAMTAVPGVAAPEPVVPGPVKIVIAEHDLPEPAALVARIRAAHGAGRAAAVHAASRVAVVLSVAAFAEAGAVAGDRLEHAAVVDPEAMTEMSRLGLTVVTQPHFIRENGDRYLATVEPDDQPWLYRGRGFLDAGVPLAAGSDAPVGGHDPWAAMAASVERRTASGEVVGAGEQLSPEQALGLYTGRPDLPGGPPRRIAPGEPADLCLIDRPWSAARRSLADVRVRATVVAGRLVFEDRADGPR